MNPQHAFVLSTGNFARQLQSSSGAAFELRAAESMIAARAAQNTFNRCRESRCVQGNVLDWRGVFESACVVFIQRMLPIIFPPN
jgi:hypothetical protein